MDSTISPLLGRYKLDARFVGTTVIHLTYKSDLATQQRVAVQTVWKTEGRLGTGAFGEVWRQRSKSGQFRAVKIISKAQVNVQEIETLISLHDVCTCPILGYFFVGAGLSVPTRVIFLVFRELTGS